MAQHIPRHIPRRRNSIPRIRFVIRISEVGEDDAPLAELTYGPAAQVWRINHGWRAHGERNGFSLDTQTGRWGQQQSALSANHEDDDIDEDAPPPLIGVKPFIQDARDILLIKPIYASVDKEIFLITLAHALWRGIQMECQVEENEVAVELLGQGERQTIMFWEAVEGGVGIAEMLLKSRARSVVWRGARWRYATMTPIPGSKAQTTTQPSAWRRATCA